MEMNTISRKELLALPERKWDDTTKEYDSLLVFSSRQKHDSGWAMMVIVGCVDYVPVEIAASCPDDLCWHFGDDANGVGQMRSDCCFRTGIMHFWGRGCKFNVGCAISSIDIVVSKDA